MHTPPKILIVAGGLSKRMGRDKSQIEIRPGLRQIDHLLQLARAISNDVFVSCNDVTKVPAGTELLPDLHPGAGPLAALEAFHARFPDDGVLLLGCDLFLIDEATIRHLIEHRSPDHAATAYPNRIDHRAEPLCAWYPPAALARAGEAIANEDFCARHFLERLNPQILELPNPVALDGANTPEELEEVMAKLELGVSSKPVKLIYYAKLREERGLDEETIDTLACTTGGLYEELRFRHRLSLRIDALRCARNGDFCDWNQWLSPNDEIVFIPPVAGG